MPAGFGTLVETFGTFSGFQIDNHNLTIPGANSMHRGKEIPIEPDYLLLLLIRIWLEGTQF